MEKQRDFVTPWCACGKHKRYRKGWLKDGSPRFHSKCRHCQGVKIYRKRPKRKGANFGNYEKLGYCEKCGFIPEHSCQLDIDHIDENRANSDPSNFQTLCANCHRLKSREKAIERANDRKNMGQ